ncbi:NupC/NupG family nucleoside CNT transporter [Candidatus Sumerlaeota bacterium]|nr:NupC/NupG family nucleoside CNT transporter [Candidatus Sumerlaeota bacterium]
MMPVLGIAAMVALCLAFSTDRKAALKRWPLFLWGFGLQVALAILALNPKVTDKLYTDRFFQWFNDAFVALVNCTNAGTSFVFGDAAQHGYLAFTVLPTIMFFSALMAILYHYGIMQRVVRALAWIMMITMKTSGAETLSASANIFVGQTEAPLMVRPFINRMTNSELMTVMTGGFATVAGGVMAAYVGMLNGKVPGIAGHLLTASLMSAPAALLFGKLFVPETETPETLGVVDVEYKPESSNMLDAVTLGTRDGLMLYLNVLAMLIVFVALVAFGDLILHGGASIFMAKDEIPDWWNLRSLIGFAFAPFAYLMGVTDPHDALLVGRLLGIKMLVNEFVAYSEMSAIAETLSPRAQIIAAYALCGFANFGSIGIQIGGLAVMAPDRRTDLSRLALRAMFAGTFACMSTACIAAIIL